MPGPTVTITAPIGNVQGVPATTGTATAAQGLMVTGLCYQVNGGPVTQIPVPTPPQNSVSWNQQMNASDCPNINVPYLLTVYAGDNTGAVGMGSSNFTRLS
jgi:hypothetical protein